MAANKRTTRTGLEDMLGKIFDSPGMNEVVDRIERVQSQAPALTLPKDQEVCAASQQIQAPALPGAPDLQNSPTIQPPLACETDNNPDNSPDEKPAKHPENTGELSGEKAKHSTKQPDSYPDTSLEYYPANGPGNYPGNRPALDPDNYPVKPEMWYPFTEKQGRVLLYLIKAGGVAKREHIAEDTGVNIATVKNTLRVLARHGYISNVQVYINHFVRGFSYNLNQHMCSEFAERLTGHPINYPAHYPANSPGGYPAKHPGYRSGGYPANSPGASFSSSRSLEKKLTTTLPQRDPHDYFNDPELAYWKEKGVSMRQVENWASEFSMDPGLVIQSLKFCRYDMVVLNQEEEKKIENPVNWFYRVMTRSGLYPRPTQYKSLAEIRAEEMERIISESSEMRERLAAAERESAFQQMLANPEGEVYQRLLGQVDEFAQSMGGKVLESAMRELFWAGKQA